MDTSVSESSPEPDSGYYSPPNDDGQIEQQFTFESGSAVEHSSRRRLYQVVISESKNQLELDMSRGVVYQRRRRSFSDPFPSKTMTQLGRHTGHLSHSYSYSEVTTSTVTRGMQTCSSFPTHSFCRCSGCTLNYNPALPLRQVAVVQPLRHQWSVKVYANEIDRGNDEQFERRVRLDAENIARRLRIMADRLDQDRGRRLDDDGLFNFANLFRVNFIEIFFRGLAEFFNF